MADAIGTLIRAEDLDPLRRRIRGFVIEPGDSRYDSARRIWNGMIDRRPAAVIRRQDSADVAAAVSFAREARVPMSVRGGGHNVGAGSEVGRHVQTVLGAELQPRSTIHAFSTSAVRTSGA